MGPVIQVGGLVYHSRLAVQPSDLGAGAPAAPPFLPRAAARPRGRGRKPGQALAAVSPCQPWGPRQHPESISKSGLCRLSMRGALSIAVKAARGAAAFGNGRAACGRVAPAEWSGRAALHCLHLQKDVIRTAVS